MREQHHRLRSAYDVDGVRQDASSASSWRLNAELLRLYRTVVPPSIAANFSAQPVTRFNPYRAVILPDLGAHLTKRFNPYQTAIPSHFGAPWAKRFSPYRAVIPPGAFKVILGTQGTFAAMKTKFAEQFRTCAPPNWQFEDEWPRFAAITAVVEDGIPLAWVPRSDIVTALVEADRADLRHAILATREADIVRDCDLCLDGVDDPALDQLVDMTRKGVRAFQGTHAEAAQALATSVLDTALRLLFAGERFKYERVRLNLEQACDRMPLQNLRTALVLYAIPGALREFFPSKGDPVPERFNRHASAHSVGRVQYTRTNAVLALMITASLLREASACGWCNEAGEAGAAC